jgi:DNA repair protein RadC
MNLKRRRRKMNQLLTKTQPSPDVGNSEFRSEVSSDLTSFRDEAIKEEYVRRFTIHAGDSIRDAKEASEHLRSYYSDAAKREKFVVLFLDSQHHVLSTEVLFEGSLNTSAVYPREVITRVIELGCAAVILGHNHPSKLTDPSSSDRAVTKKLQTALTAIDVKILDHIIIGGSDYFSFSEHHLL